MPTLPCILFFPSLMLVPLMLPNMDALFPKIFISGVRTAPTSRINLFARMLSSDNDDFSPFIFACTLIFFPFTAIHAPYPVVVAHLLYVIVEIFPVVAMLVFSDIAILAVAPISVFGFIVIVLNGSSVLFESNFHSTLPYAWTDIS